MKILDLAAGENPYFLRYEISWKEEDEYFYFDSSYKRLAESREKIAKSENKPLDNKLNFLIGDSVQLPFADASFDKIIASNFLSAPIHWGWNELTEEVKIIHNTQEVRRPVLKNPDKFDYFYNERVKSISEISRVLKIGGKFYLYTDLIIYGQASYSKVLEELKNSSSYSFSQLITEQQRVDILNISKSKIKYDDNCVCFLADVLPHSEVYEFIKVK